MHAWLAVAAVAISGVAGCIGSTPASTEPADPIILTIRTSRDPAACCAASEIPVGAPALAGYADVSASWHDMDEFVRLKERAQVKFDAGCQPTGRILPDCSGLVVRDQYRVWRLATGLQPGDDYPLDDAGEVRLILPEPMVLFLGLNGRISDGYPQVAQHESCEDSWYRADRVLSVSGEAEDISTATSSPHLDVRGSATVELGWVMGAGCGTPR